MLAFGLCIMLACIWHMGYFAAQAYQYQAWIQLKPYFWLRASAINEYSSRHWDNIDELHRRLSTGLLTPSQCQNLSEEVIDLCKRNPQWTNSYWREILNDLLKNRSFTQKQLEDLVQNITTLKLEIKSSLRQDQMCWYRVHEKTPYLGGNIRFKIINHTQALFVNDQLFQSNNVQLPSDYTARGTNTYRSWDFKVTPTTFPAGQTVKLKSLQTITLQLMEPATYDPFTITFSDTADIKIVGKDDLTDTFIQNPKMLEKVKQAWVSSRVIHENGMLTAALRIDSPPVDMAMSFWLIDGEKELLMGHFITRNSASPQWHKSSMSNNEILSEKVYIELRPDQTAADHQTELREYWGMIMRSEPIIVNEPYVVPFNRNSQWIPMLEKAVWIGQVGRSKSDRLDFSIDTKNLPVRLNVIVQIKHLKETARRRFPTRLEINKDEYRHNTSIKLPGDPKVVDLLLVPNENWGKHWQTRHPAVGVSHSVSQRASATNR